MAKKEVKKNISKENKFDLKNPYNLLGFIAFIVGAVTGGAWGGFMGAVIAIIIYKIGQKKYSTKKKIIFVILTLIIGLIVYFIVGTILYMILDTIFHFK